MLDSGPLTCYTKRAYNKVGADGIRPHPAAHGAQRSICKSSGPGGARLFLCGCLQCIRIFLWRWVPIANQGHLINEEIQVPEVRLISDAGEQLGLMSAEAALQIAVDKEMDLVMIAPGSKPPVCKIMDYGKFRFEQSKREKEAKKNQRVVEIKEIRMSPSIGENDFGTKLRNGQKFLSEGNRLKVTVRFRGREMAHTNIGEQLLKSFAEKCEELATMDKNPKLEGRNMSMFLSPRAK